MNTDIITHAFSEVNDDIHAGIPCHDAGQPFPCWCPGCLEEADSRELIALRTAAGTCRYEVPPGLPCLDTYGDVPAPRLDYTPGQIAAMAMLNAIEDDEMEGEEWHPLW